MIKIESHIFKTGLYAYPHTLVIIITQEMAERGLLLFEVVALSDLYQGLGQVEGEKAKERKCFELF